MPTLDRAILLPIGAAGLVALLFAIYLIFWVLRQPEGNDRMKEIAKAIQEGVSLADVYETLQTFMGGNLVNYFNRFGRQWQTYVEAEGTSRTNIDNIGRFYVQNASGNSIPLSALTSIKRITGPEFTMRYNEYESAQLIATAAPGYSSSQATQA